MSCEFIQSPSDIACCHDWERPFIYEPVGKLPGNFLRGSRMKGSTWTGLQTCPKVMNNPPAPPTPLTQDPSAPSCISQKIDLKVKAAIAHFSVVLVLKVGTYL